MEFKVLNLFIFTREDVADFFILVALRLSLVMAIKRNRIKKNLFLLQKIANIDKSRKHSQLPYTHQPPSVMTLLIINHVLFIPLIHSLCSRIFWSKFQTSVCTSKIWLFLNYNFTTIITLKDNDSLLLPVHRESRQS